MAGKEIIALQLEDAKQSLEAQLRQALSTYGQKVRGIMEFDLSALRTAGDPDMNDGERSLRNTVRTIVDEFHRNDVVAQTGLRVFKITAIDSNNDGEVALNVKYEYGTGTSVGDQLLSAGSLPFLPSRSADFPGATESDEMG